MKQVGNVKSNRKYNPDEMRNRPPTNMEESERDSELEKYIRTKYQFRRFMEGRPPPVPSKDATFLTSPPPSSGRSGAPRSPTDSSSLSKARTPLAQGSSIARSRTAPIPSTWSEAQQRVKASAPPMPSPAATGFRAASGPLNNGGAASSAATQSSLQLPSTAVPMRTSSALNARNVTTAAFASNPASSTAQSSVFDDLISLSEPASQTTTNQPPLQMNPWASLQAQQPPVLSAPAIQEPDANFWAGQTASAGGASVMAPFGVSPSNNVSALGQVRSIPQHANTAPTLGVASSHPQATGMLSPAGGMIIPQYQQQRSASLGTMAFSTSPMPSPGFVANNPFNAATQTNLATSMPQSVNFGGQFQQQQLGQLAFQGQSTMHTASNAFYGQPPQQQMQPAGNVMGQFPSSMMPNGFGQSPQYGRPFMQQPQ